jgi:hypothetical protein
MRTSIAPEVIGRCPPAGRCGSAARRAAELVFREMGLPLVLNVPLYGGLPSADARTAADDWKVESEEDR